MPIKTECTGCGSMLRVPDEMLGRKVKCPKCQTTFTAVDPDAAPPKEDHRDEPPPPPRSAPKDYDDEPPRRSSARDYDDEPESRPSRSGRRNYDDDDRDSGRRDRRDDDDDRDEGRGRRDDDDRDEPRGRRGSDRDDYDDDRRLSRRDDDDYDDRRSLRRRDDDDYDDRRSRRRGGGEKPGSVQTAGILMLIGGIVATLSGLWVALAFLAGSAGICCLYPSYIYALVAGIMAIVRGAALLGENAYKAGPSRGIAIMLIINIVNFDVFGMVLGIIALVMLNNEESKRYFGE